MALFSRLAQRIAHSWYTPHAYLILRPPAALYAGLMCLRQWAYRVGLWRRWRAPVPVVVVGNICVGGTGKTPLTIALVEQLQRWGLSPGVVSRGYGSKAPHYPFAVAADSPSVQSGDEPLLIAQRTGCPVVIDGNRRAAVQALLEANDCDVIVADDGLQHLALARDYEYLLIDSQRLLGNGYCLPAGPLRESARRLQQVDQIVLNGEHGGDQLPGLLDSHHMRLQACYWVNLQSGEQRALSAPGFSGRVHAVAGIGNPQRFFSSLCGLGFDIIEHVFADHCSYAASDLNFGDGLPVVMTEKDAVKLRNTAQPHWWFLRVDAQLDADFFLGLRARLIACGLTL